MSTPSNNAYGFREVWTHTLARQIVEDTIREYRGFLDVEILRHDYNSASPDGKIMVHVRQNNAITNVRYGLPDSIDGIRGNTLEALRHPSDWKTPNCQEIRELLET